MMHNLGQFNVNCPFYYPLFMTQKTDSLKAAGFIFIAHRIYLYCSLSMGV